MQPLTAVVFLQVMSGSGNNVATDSCACVGACVCASVCVCACKDKITIT